jgi:hypothetical protein
MSMALDLRCRMVPLVIPVGQELSVCIGVGGWGYPISSRMVRIISASLALSKRPANSASVAEDMTFLRMLLTVWIAPLLGGCVFGGVVGSSGLELR